MTSFSILVTDTFRPVFLYLDIMTSYTLSPFLLTHIQTDGAVMNFYFLVLLHAAYFCVFFFSSCFCLFLRQILAEAEEVLSKMKVDSSQTVHMKL